MKERDEKKAWKTPQLTVLARIDFEESILVTCKRSTGTGGPNNQNNQCQGWSWQTFSCLACSTQRAS